MVSLDDVMLHKALVDFLQNMRSFPSSYDTRKVKYDSPNNTRQKLGWSSEGSLIAKFDVFNFKGSHWNY